MKVRIDITSAIFRNRKTADARANFTAMQQAAARYGFELGMQLHNSADDAEVKLARSLQTPLSFHAPVGNPWNINLAAADASTAWEELQDNAERMRDCQATIAVFHAFIMTDKPIPAFGRGRSYMECMQRAFRPELSFDGSDCHCGNFFALPEYRLRQQRLKERLAELRQRYPDLTFCGENDFPTFGAGNLLADQLNFLEHPVCLDTSHLWCTAGLFELDYHREIEKFLAGQRVQMVHLHASSYPRHTPRTLWWDGHLPLRTPNEMDLPRIVAACRQYRVAYFVLEISDATVEDIDYLAEMWQHAASGKDTR